MGRMLRGVPGKGTAAVARPAGPDRGPGRSRRIAVWEKTATGWRVLTGSVGGPVPRVLHVAELPAPGGSPFGRPKGSECVLVLSSRRCVVRTVQLPPVPEADRQRMLEVRLETELPYPPGEAVWGHQVRPSGAGGPASVLVVAVPADELAQAEKELAASGRRCDVVEAREVVLAQFAECLAAGLETAAVVAAEPDGVTVAVTHEGRMACARVLALAPAREGDPAAQTALEVDQTLQHFTYESGLGMPEAVFVVGSGPSAERVAARLRVSTELPVRDLPAAAPVEVAPQAGVAAHVLRAYAPCVGALVAAHERARGREAAGPAVRAHRAARRGPTVQGVVRLALINLLLIAALIASGFAVRRSRLDAVRRAVAEARPLLAQIGPLEEEVRVLQEESSRAGAKLDLLRALARTLPDGIELADVRIDRRGNVTVRGQTPSIEAVSKAVAALEGSEEFGSPHLDRAEPVKQGMTFQISCTVQ